MEDEFGTEIIDAIFRAAKADPNGGSQASSAKNGRTLGEITVSASYDDKGNLAYELSEGQRLVARVPEERANGSRFAIFTNLIPGIEPDLTSYPHEILGIWAIGGEIGAFMEQKPAGTAG